MQFGDLRLDLLSDGDLWLDGGAMFGVVPKTLWERNTPSDPKNRIRLGLNCLLIRTPDTTILVDTGCGHKYSPKQLEIYSIEHEKELLHELSSCGLEPEDIDIVVNTHLHFDHCGGNTRLHQGVVTATFPNATYMVRRTEYEEACHPNARTRATYFPHNWEVLSKTGQLQLIDQDCEIAPGVALIGTPGHTLGHQSVQITTEQETIFYMADLCPTQAHVPLAWIMAFDLYPMTTLQTRQTIYPRAVEEEWLLLFEHDPDKPAGYLMEEQGKYMVRPHPWGAVGTDPENAQQES